MFVILNVIGVINIGMVNVVCLMKGRELLMIFVCMIVFGCGFVFCVNFEEFLVFVLFVFVCCYVMGFDLFIVVGIIFCVVVLGYVGVIINVFIIGVV